MVFRKGLAAYWTLILFMCVLVAYNAGKRDGIRDHRTAPSTQSSVTAPIKESLCLANTPLTIVGYEPAPSGQFGGEVTLRNNNGTLMLKLKTDSLTNEDDEFASVAPGTQVVFNLQSLAAKGTRIPSLGGRCEFTKISRMAPIRH